MLSLLRDRGLKPSSVHEVRELQTALGLVAAEAGVCVVPASVERLRRDNVVHRPLDKEEAASPIIMKCRKDDRPPEIACPPWSWSRPCTAGTASNSGLDLPALTVPSGDA